MNIISGNKLVHLKTEQTKDVTCPSCNFKENTITSIYSRHFHLFWIPMFLTGKVIGFQCNN